MRETTNQLQKIRERLGLTQRQVAERIHRTVVTVSRYESEDQRLTLPLLRQLAKVLGCSIAEIIGEKEYTPKEFSSLIDVILMEKIIELITIIIAEEKIINFTTLQIARLICLNYEEAVEHGKLADRKTIKRQIRLML